ncbi:serine/threonine protein kinase [Calothrix sp. 336/3]|uniref:serine/threonine protein kinase n=1 Tax=Calothrix sp. 336/3 TaxID=1337936 RepID=UPI00069CA00C|nr:serine/threonine-protein kinase [Calothrix sp. 336/3]
MNSYPNSDPWIGRYIGEHQRYRLDQRLGGGGMGDVYLAMDTRLGQQVALKLLKGTLIEYGDIRRRFEREVAVCAALQSDNIVKVSDYGIGEDGHPFYVMEYLRGETLRHLMMREGRLSINRAVGIIIQACRGLQLAHAGVTLQRDGATASEHIQVVHRDLKPDNIILVPTYLGELVKILDFGIAKIRNDSNETTNLTGAFLGTFRYAAPEQLRGDRDLDGRADIYSLGIILYEMLSHADPFGFSVNARHVSEASWIWAHTAESPTPLRSQPGCENISPEIEAVVMRCLQKEPEQRFASVVDLTYALQIAVRNSGITLDESVSQSLTKQGESVEAETFINQENQIEALNSQKIPLVELESSPDIIEGETLPPSFLVSPPEPTLPSTLEESPPQPRTLPETILQVPSATIEFAHPQEQNISPTPAEANYPGKFSEPASYQGQNSQVATPVNPSKSIPILSMAIAAIVAIIGGVFAYMQFVPKVSDQIRSLKDEGRYAECLQKSEAELNTNNTDTQIFDLLQECRLERAKKLAENGLIAEAIALAEKIPQNSSLYPEAQRYLKDWKVL